VRTDAQANNTGIVIAAAFAQGFLSMGFQLVGSRILAPYFGTTLIVWAFIISTFLAAFSTGAMTGGALSRRSPEQIGRGMLLVGLLGTLGFAMVALLGRPVIAAVDAAIPATETALLIVCPALFLAPVACLSAVLPVFTEVLVRRGGGGGASTGTIYGVSTLGNISGVMVTTFLLIPHFPTSTLLILWLVAGTACFWTFQRLVATGLGQRRAAVA
jgi:hypothetical protein